MPTPIAFPPECEAVIRALWDYLDGALDELQLTAIEAHLAICETCRARTSFERRLIDEIHALRNREQDATTLRSRILDAINRARADES